MANLRKNSRKVFATSVSAALVATAVAPAAVSADHEFSDVPSDNPYHDEIKALVEAGVITGFEDGTFKLGAQVTRAQAAQVMYQLFDLEVSADTELPFTDVEADAWYADAVKAVYEAEIMVGQDEDSFAPDAKMTRKELVQMIYGAYDLDAAPDTELPFDDVDEDAWYAEALKALYAEGLIAGVDEDSFAPDAQMKRGDFAFLTVQTDYAVGDNLPKPEPEQAEVESAIALNGTEILVTFNKEVDKTTAEDEANYLLKEEGNAALASSAYTAEVQNDGKSVLITLATPVPNTEAAVFTFAVENVKVKDSLNEEFPVYTQTITVYDTTAASLSSVVSKTNSETASSVTLVFDEPVLMPTVKIDGVTRSVSSLSADGKVAVINNLSLDASETHTVEIINLTDKSGNVNANIEQSFNITLDTVAPNYSLSTASDSMIILSFDKVMDPSTINQSNIEVKDENLDDLQLTDYKIYAISPYDFVIEFINSDPYAAADTREFTILTNDSIEDYLGNNASATTKTVTLTKDEVAPSLQSIDYVKNASGVVTDVLFTYDENISVNSTAGLTAKNLVTGETVGLFGTNPAEVLSDGKTVKVDVTTGSSATITSGEYEVNVPANFVYDSAFTANYSTAVKQVVDFGSGNAAVLTVNDVIEQSRNEFLIKFSNEVTYASATNPTNYTVNGATLPSNASISFNGTSRNEVIVNLPDGFISSDDTGAVLRVHNVKTAAGTLVSANQFVVTVDDNTGPKISESNSNINSNGTLTLGFNEAVASIATVTEAGVLADLEFHLNGVEVTSGGASNITVEDGTGGDAGKYVLTFNTLVDTTSETAAGNDATVTEYFDVDGDNAYSSNDVLVNKLTGLTDTEANNYSPVSVLDLNDVADLSVGTKATTSNITDTNNNPNVIQVNQTVVIK